MLVVRRLLDLDIDYVECSISPATCLVLTFNVDSSKAVYLFTVVSSELDIYGSEEVVCVGLTTIHLLKCSQWESVAGSSRIYLQSKCVAISLESGWLHIEHSERFFTCCRSVIYFIKALCADGDRKERLLVGFTICLVVSINGIYSCIIAACARCALVFVLLAGSISPAWIPSSAFPTAASCAPLNPSFPAAHLPMSYRPASVAYVFVCWALTWLVVCPTVSTFSTARDFMDVCLFGIQPL